MGRNAGKGSMVIQWNATEAMSMRGWKIDPAREDVGEKHTRKLGGAGDAEKGE